MKNIYCLLLCLSSFIIAAAQTKPGSNAYPYRDSARQKPIDIREKLVQLAMQNPNYEIAEREVAIANNNLRKTKGSIGGLIGVSANINETTINPPKTGNGDQIYYPKYNIGATVPLNYFGVRNKEIKNARQNLAIAEAQKNQKFREIKAQVLTVYEDYLMHKQMLEFQTQITQDANTNYQAMEKDFADGLIKQEEFNKAYLVLTEQQTKKLALQRNLNVTKLELESLIGVSIDELLATYKK